MRDFFDALYQYALENRAEEYLQTPEYRQSVRDLEENWAAFRAGLTEEQERTLDALLSQQGIAGRLEDEASFLAGVSIGLDLGRI